ncbi:MAG: cob(I)yrinic acid a,c-diamide adenosyltransferase [Bacteroides sp.]|nr:cob(I)yrinic acid a,c-diamide adenosyltransferase [Bacteroides sp.]MCM1446687.1 cob(I)yrinic acid a,c-diamide adenosyltransferase [Bacteroides sp.]
MTDLVGGCRVRKDCMRLEAYGTVDELNSHMGLLVAAMDDETAINCIHGCQSVLLAMGAVLATDKEAGGHTGQAVTDGDIAGLERTIDAWSEDLPPWRGFVLPGGTEAAARAHVCRTVCRRAERCILALAREADVPGEVLRYVNRLSDLFFVLAQRLNFLAGKEEILWQKRMP